MEHERITVAYVMEKIDQIMAGDAALREGIAMLENLDDGAAIAAGNMVEAREKTNQQMLALLNKIIDKLEIN
ncbi:MAG: hypothetical protein HFF72_14155 [Oscillospiraceae bacterium]|nr:hypothetical protein [Oscillospiraceae bacterium]MCI8721986.1 hypothetical protein [Oscillospiraceae bacterium]MCI8943987.1 hypothetical protein [Oscillospiraceae bacterium]